MTFWLPRIAAALLLLAIGGVLGWGADKLPLFDLQEKRFLKEALAAHFVYAEDQTHAVEVFAKDREHLQVWLSMRLGTKVSAPDLSEAGLTFLGGRLLSASTGPAAFLVYETEDRERVTCYITAEPDRLAPKQVYLEAEATGALAWPVSGLAFALSAAPGRERLVEIAGLINAELLKNAKP